MNIPLPEIFRILSVDLAEDLVEIGELFKPGSKAGFADRLVLQQQIFSLVDPAVIDEICEGHARLLFEIPAERGCGHVYLLRDVMHIGIEMIIGIHIIIHNRHAVFRLLTVTMGAIVQLHHIVTGGHDLEDLQEVEQLMKVIKRGHFAELCCDAEFGIAGERETVPRFFEQCFDGGQFGCMEETVPEEIFFQLHHDLIDLRLQAVIEIQMRHIGTNKD